MREGHGPRVEAPSIYEDESFQKVIDLALANNRQAGYLQPIDTHCNLITASEGLSEAQMRAGSVIEGRRAAPRCHGQSDVLQEEQARPNLVADRCASLGTGEWDPVGWSPFSITSALSSLFLAIHPMFTDAECNSSRCGCGVRRTRCFSRLRSKRAAARIVKSQHKGPKPFQPATVFQKRGSPGKGRPLRDCGLEFALCLQRDESRPIGDDDMV